jgi:hypothetical protein
MCDTNNSCVEKSTEDNMLEAVKYLQKEDVEITRENIEKIKNIKLVDSDETAGLDLFCYTHCTPADDDIVKQCRGLVFNGNNLILKGFSYTYEYDENVLDKISNNINYEKCLFYESYEGSVIRMFYFGDKWYITTHRKLDAYRSKWASKKSFGEYFEEYIKNEYSINENFKKCIDYSTNSEDNIMDKFKSLLDKKKQYLFLLLNSNENRLVSKRTSERNLYHVGTFIDFKLNMDYDNTLCIPYPKKLEFKDTDSIKKYLLNIDYNECQGVIIFFPNNIQYKIYNKNYQNLLYVRGNEPSIKFRYLQIRMNADDNKTLRKLFPEYLNDFEEYENYIYKIAKIIYKAYIDRFIKKLYVITPVEQFNVIREIHSWHLEDRIQNRINLNKVIDILNQQYPTNINKMIRSLIQENKENEELKTKNSDNLKQGNENKEKIIKRKKKYTPSAKEHKSLLKKSTVV